MSGIEVAALVAAIISAFSGAHGLISKFKKKRRERRLNKQNENAELALTSAGSRVQHAYDVDFRRLGSKFAKGDGKQFHALHAQFVESTDENTIQISASES